jgi:hypothetical protein
MSQQQWTVTDSVAGVTTGHASPHDQWDAVRRAISAPPAPRVEPWAERNPSGLKETAA